MIRIFMSYSISKAFDPDLTREAIKITKRRISSFGNHDFEVEDAMDPGIDSVHNKVEISLRNSDALVAEATTSSPNVMFELGFARANKYPTIILVNRNAFENEELSKYFNFLGLSKNKPLPADLGDIEYIDYSSDIYTAGGLQYFEKRIDKALGLICRSLPSGMIMLRRGERALQEKTNQLAELTNESTNDPPLLRLLGGWLEQVIQELGEAGSQGFLVDSKYYPSCFAKFRDSERQAACAIADLTDGTEPLSTLNSEEIQMAVGERIFLMSGNHFFNEIELKQIFDGIKQHIESSDIPNYKVLIAWAENHHLPSEHPFGKSEGRNLLLIDPSLIGGYITLNERPYLSIAASKETFKNARKYYESIKNKSFRFDGNWIQPSQLRAAWLSHEIIGDWSPSWNYDYRDVNYYSYYDFHIRAWIPDYTRLIKATASKVLEKLKSANNNGQVPKSILEIGCGTGQLTQAIARELFFLESTVDKGSLCESFIAIDKASEMIERAKKNIEKESFPGTKVRIVQGNAFEGIPSHIKHHKPFDLICGSLVLNHLLRENAVERLEETLPYCSELLKVGGSIILSDAFVEDPSEKEAVARFWREAMLRYGLSPLRADRFLSNNQGMLNTISVSQLQDICGKHNFLCEIDVVEGLTVQHPFRILTFTLLN